MVLLTDSVLKQPHRTASRVAQSTQLHHEGTYLSAEHVGIDRPERRAPLYWYNQSKGGCAFMLQSLPAYKKKVNWIKQNGKQLSFAIPHDHHSCDIIYDVCVIKTLNGFAKGKEKKKEGKQVTTAIMEQPNCGAVPVQYLTLQPLHLICYKKQ